MKTWSFVSYASFLFSILRPCFFVARSLFRCSFYPFSILIPFWVIPILFICVFPSLFTAVCSLCSVSFIFLYHSLLFLHFLFPLICLIWQLICILLPSCHHLYPAHSSFLSCSPRILWHIDRLMMRSKQKQAAPRTPYPAPRTTIDELFPGLLWN